MDAGSTHGSSAMAWARRDNTAIRNIGMTVCKQRQQGKGGWEGERGHAREHTSGRTVLGTASTGARAMSEPYSTHTSTCSNNGAQTSGFSLPTITP
eukprot:6558323-Prymnesium_polylepis.1